MYQVRTGAPHLLYSTKIDIVTQVSYRNLCPSCYNGIKGLSRIMFSLLDDYVVIPAVSNIEFCNTNDSLVCAKFA